MLKEREAVARTIFVLADALVIAIAFTLSFFLRKEIVPTFLRPLFPQVPEVSPAAGFVIERYLIFLVLAIVLWCLSLFANDMYHSMRTQSYVRIIWMISKAAGWTFLGFGAVLYFFKVTYVGRFFFLLFAGSSFLLIVAEKTALLLFIRYHPAAGPQLPAAPDRRDRAPGGLVHPAHPRPSGVGVPDPGRDRRRAGPGSRQGRRRGHHRHAR